LTNKVDSYVKDDNLNLGTLKYTLASMANCEYLDLSKPFARTCFWAFDVKVLSICNKRTEGVHGHERHFVERYSNNSTKDHNVDKEI
jgi:hypothetical protein